MQIRTFNTYENYVKAQRRANKRKSSKTHHPANEIPKIVQWWSDRWGTNTKFAVDLHILCHGCGNGAELDEFQSSLGGGVPIVGTDLFPQREDIVKHDFHRLDCGHPDGPMAMSNWKGNFDIVYSNSLDHSDRPRECLATWLDQLKPDGYLFIEWSASHIEVDGGDCFGAALHEYMWLLNGVGTFVDFIYCGDSVVLVGKK